jgi:hypothetical protein
LLVEHDSSRVTEEADQPEGGRDPLVIGLVALILVLALAIGAVLVTRSNGDDGIALSSTEPTTPPTTVATTVATPAPEPEPLMTGDAATNAACALASVAEIEQQVNAGVVQVAGLASPGAFGTIMVSCTWFLDSKDIGIPSVSVQWESPVDSWHDPVVDQYRSLVDQGLASVVEGIGEHSIWWGGVVETIASINIVRVSVLMHPEPTPADQQNAIALLRLTLERVEQTATSNPEPAPEPEASPEPSPEPEASPEPSPVPEPSPAPASAPEPAPDNPVDGLWDACDAGDMAACDELYWGSPPGSESEAFASYCGDWSVSPLYGNCSGAGYGDDPYFDQLWASCDAGDMGACDELFWGSPPGSEYEAFASYCGNWSADQIGGYCAATLG